jgi:CRP-like cAMP-binding protein
MIPSDWIEKHPVFAKFTPKDQPKLKENAVERSYNAGQWIRHHGEIWPNLFLVLSGSITALKESPEGRSLIIETIGPGEILWGIAFFEPEAPMPVALVADEDSRVLIWPQEKIQQLFMDNPAALWELCRLVVRRVQRASDILDELAFQPVAERLARFLVDRFGGVEGERVARNLTLDEMAAHIGTTREMVCRMLHKFSNQGLIDITRTEFVFTDQDGLNQLAQKNGNIRKN